MPQTTVVLEIPPAERADLCRRLGELDVEVRSVPHALCSVRGLGVVATLYRSGKLVIQGDHPEAFAERYVGRAPEAPAAPAPVSARASEASIGSDECGKGDYFGPLVVVAVRLEPGQERALRASSVRDSKTMSDDTALRLGGALRSQVAFAVARLDPPQYNALYTRPGQLNDILADLHVQAVGELARPGIRVLVDQFAGAALLQRKMKKLGVQLEQRHRAESDPAVAAASVIAREEYLVALRELSERFGLDLHKGAGTPTDRSAAAFMRLHGRDALPQVAKMHFKNTQKLPAD